MIKNKTISLFPLCFLLSFLTHTAEAALVDCEIFYNLEPVLQSEVTTSPGVKKSIGESEGVSAFITEKDNGLFLVEAFISDYDVRGYSEGRLIEHHDKISFSLWGRNSMIDVNCRLAK